MLLKQLESVPNFDLVIIDINNRGLHIMYHLYDMFRMIGCPRHKPIGLSTGTTVLLL